MRFNLKRPCAECPFRTDKNHLSAERAAEIASGLLEGDASFSCHKTLDYEGDDGEGVHTSETEHCAGAAIFLMHQDMPNQIMRIAYRMRWASPDDLDMDAPVHRDRASFIRAHDR